jgi:hypothetical protein
MPAFPLFLQKKGRKSAQRKAQRKAQRENTALLTRVDNFINVSGERWILHLGKAQNGV